MTLGEIRKTIEEARRHANMLMEQAIFEISSAIDGAEFLTHALSRTSSDADVAAVEALLANARTALEAATFLPMADRDVFKGRIQIVETTLASIRMDIAAHPTAVANAIDLVANDNRQDGLGEFIGGWWRREHGIGGQQASVTRSYDGGGSVNAILSHDENGQLQHNVAIYQNKSYQQLETTDIRVRVDRAGRHINTREDPQELEGVIRSTRSISDHGLGAEWQVTELTSDYDGGGTLKIHVATDVEPADGSVDTFATVTNGYGNIEFSEAPALPADRDFLVVRFDPGYGVEGSLGEDAGFFYCPIFEDCYLSIDRRSGGYYAVSTGLTFTPDGGTEQPVLPTLAGTAPAADYLAFGHWLYVPDDAAEPDDVPPTLGYDFGVFASGGDPFATANLRGLTGTATYEGDAGGMYYVGGLSSSPDVGSFTAEVELTANFGSNVETGTIGGQVSNFEFESDVASSLPTTVALASYVYDYLPEGFGVEQGTSNIFDTPWRDEVAPYPGGWVGGRTQASVDGQNWYGSWSGAFYGNGTATTDHPTSVAGEFSSYPWGDGNHNQRDTGLTGSFGAHRLAEATPPPLFMPGTFQTSHELQASAIQMDWRSFHNDTGASIAYGDFDNDGDEDFFIVPDSLADRSVCAPGDSYCLNPTYFQIWENVGENKFNLNTQKFFSGPLPQLINVRKTITGDFNGDGKLDLFLATHGPAAPPLPREEPPLLVLSSDNGFVKSPDLAHLVGYNHTAASADIDNDGDLDIFVSDLHNSPYMLVNDGKGNFRHDTTLVPPELDDINSDTAELVDVDSDGNPDLIAVAPADKVSVYWGDGTGKYTNSRKTILPEAVGYDSIDFDVGDLDGDGNNDIVVNLTARNPSYTGFAIQLISGLGNRHFSDTTSHQIDFGEKDVDKWVLWLRLVDINDDGSLDIVVDGNFAQPGTTWLNDGSGNLALVRERPRPYLFDWMKVANGLSDAQVRQGMNSVISASDSLVHVSASASGNARTFGAANPVAGSVGNVDLGNVAYQELAGFHSPRIPLALGYRERGGDSFLGFGAWLDHSMFGVTGSVDVDSAIEANAYSLGAASGSNPVSGTATWSGGVVGIDGHALGRGQVVQGESEVTVDFADSTVDVELSGMTFLARGHSWIHDMTWNDLPLNSDGFGTGADDNFIEGRFYGSGHEEVGGVFMRNHIAGAFGGKRVE